MLASSQLLLASTIFGAIFAPLKTSAQLSTRKDANTTDIEPYWSYKNISGWPLLYPACGKGQRQSPIYLTPANTYLDADLIRDPLHFTNYLNKSRTFPGVLYNDGRTVKWTLNADALGKNTILPRISGSGLKAWYLLDHIAFHWGDPNAGECHRGSEHVVGDEFTSAPVEVHFVHYNMAYKTYKMARDKTDGVAIVAFFLNKPPKTADQYQQVIDADYSQLTTEFINVRQEEHAKQIYLNIGNLMPFATWRNRFNDSISNSNKTLREPGVGYYRYDGSLSAPPCSESVIWTVYPEMVQITADQLATIMTTISTNTITPPGQQALIVDNYRPIQKANKRYVTTNSRRLIETSHAATTTVASMCLLAFSLLFHRFY